MIALSYEERRQVKADKRASRKEARRKRREAVAALREARKEHRRARKAGHRGNVHKLGPKQITLRMSGDGDYDLFWDATSTVDEQASERGSIRMSLQDSRGMLLARDQSLDTTLHPAGLTDASSSLGDQSSEGESDTTETDSEEGAGPLAASGFTPGQTRTVHAAPSPPAAAGGEAGSTWSLGSECPRPYLRSDAS